MSIKYLGYNTDAISNAGTVIYISTASASVDGFEYSASGSGTTLETSVKDAQAKLNTYLTQIPNTLSTPASNHGDKNNLNHNKNGGGNKPITEKQKSFIQNLAGRKGIDIEAMILKKFTKKLDELIGTEANEVIKGLNNENW